MGNRKIKIGNLYRWVLPLDKDSINTYPISTKVLPWDKKQKEPSSNRHLIAKEVIMPGQPIDPDKTDLQSIGFRVTFVRIDPDTGKETLSYTNPALVSDIDTSASKKGGKKEENGKESNEETKKGTNKNNPPGITEKGKTLTPDGNTELVNVELTVWQLSRETGKPNAFDISFRVKPRN